MMMNHRTTISPSFKIYNYNLNLQSILKFSYVTVPHHMKKICKFMVNILQTKASHEPRIWEDSHR